MRILILASALQLLTTAVLAQPRRSLREIQREEQSIEQLRRDERRLFLELKKLDVRWQKNTRGEYEFFCDNRTWSDYTIEVNFPEFINLQYDGPIPVTAEAPPGTHMLFTLRRATAGKAAHFTFHYHSYKGRPSPKIDTSFAYLLPLGPGRETRVYELTYLGEKLGSESQPKDWYALSLHAVSGDTVYAARRGRVTNVSDNANLQDSNYSYSHSENYIEIEHNDYTFAKYSVFTDSAIFVHPGDFVEAGQPLGIVGGEKYTGGPQVRFSVFYQLRQEVLDKDGNSTGRSQNWAYVPVRFWTKEAGKIQLANKGTYTGDDPSDLITKEMTKKEAKKWKEAHKAS